MSSASSQKTEEAKAKALQLGKSTDAVAASNDDPQPLPVAKKQRVDAPSLRKEAPKADGAHPSPAKKQRVVETRVRTRRVGTVVPAELPRQEQAAVAAATSGKVHTTRHDEKWNVMFDKLVAYKNAHNGSTMVPQCYHDDPRLGRWVHYQRVEYWAFQSTGKGKISSDRIRRLEEIGMEWDPQRAQWNAMAAKLRAFADTHGHCKIPKGYQIDPELANWVRNQRLEYANLQRGKRSRMTQDRIDLLNAMGFQWSTSIPARSKKRARKAAKPAATSRADEKEKDQPVTDAGGEEVTTAA